MTAKKIPTATTVAAMLESRTKAGDRRIVSVEKTGKDVNYYLVDIKDPKRLEPYKAECEDIIEAMQMTFAEGNVFKSLWRSCAARTFGTLKEGQDSEGIYDAEKMAYYSSRVLTQRKRLKS